MNTSLIDKAKLFRYEIVNMKMIKLVLFWNLLGKPAAIGDIAIKGIFKAYPLNECKNPSQVQRLIEKITPAKIIEIRRSDFIFNPIYAKVPSFLQVAMIYLNTHSCITARHSLKPLGIMV